MEDQLAVNLPLYSTVFLLIVAPPPAVDLEILSDAGRTDMCAHAPMAGISNESTYESGTSSVQLV
jgi:hypothetical protein